MEKLEIGDIIRYDSPKEGCIYGKIADISGGKLEIEYLDDCFETFMISAKDAVRVDMIYIDDDTAAKFARYELTFQDIAGDIYPHQAVRTHKKYDITKDDLICVLKKASGIPAEQFRKEWFVPVYDELCDSFSYGTWDMSESGDSGYRFLPSENYFVWNAMNITCERLYDGNTDYSDIIEELEFWNEQYKLPVPLRQYDDRYKTEYIKFLDNDDVLNTASEDETALFVRYVDELCEKNNKTALHVKAYGCYGGNRAFPCDWKVSRDCLLKLTEIDDDPFLANTLGYIYYYGRCNDGIPEYDKAFRYFSIGAAGYIYESRYKLSDMFRHGYGTPKNEKIAAIIIRELYSENINYMLDGKLDTKFADIALRMGNLFRDGVGCTSDPDRAYFYYLQADFAIRMRMLEDDHYGDRTVAEGIRKAIDEILPQTSYTKTVRTVRYRTVEDILYYRHKKNCLMEMKIRKISGGEYSLQFRILPRADEKYQPKLFVTEPRAQFCGLTDGISVKTSGCRKIKTGSRILKEDTAVVVFDSISDDTLYMYGKRAAEFDCREYTAVYPAKKKSSQKTHFVSVVFNTGGRYYDYICNIPGIGIGDKVIVETDSGETEVEVVRMFDKDPTETAFPISKYKTILRKSL